MKTYLKMELVDGRLYCEGEGVESAEINVSVGGVSTTYRAEFDTTSVEDKLAGKKSLYDLVEHDGGIYQLIPEKGDCDCDGCVLYTPPSHIDSCCPYMDLCHDTHAILKKVR